MGLEKGGLYNGGESPEERRSKDSKEKHWGRFTVALGRTPSEITTSSTNLLLGHHLK